MAGGTAKDAVKGTKTCVCYTNECNHCEGGACYESTCTDYKSGCLSDCEGCKKMKCEAGRPCKCCTPICGCQEDCYKEGSKNECKGLGANCKRCQTKCQKGKPCMCYRCSCGTQCNGFLCACCYWCNRSRCKRDGTCDGFVLGKCYSGGKTKCKGHGTYDDNGRPVYVTECTCEPKGNNSSCNCYKSKYDNKCRCIRGVSDGYGNCLIICDLCGKLCSQDSYIHQGTLVVVPLAIAMVLIIVWVKYRDKLRKVFYELRGSFSRAPKHSSAYTNNLVGDKIPEEMNTDGYSFPPMPYYGLS